jgi:hypothetical protein
MPRLPKGTTQLNVSIPVTLVAALKDWSERTGVPVTRLVEDAVREFLISVTGEVVQ